MKDIHKICDSSNKQNINPNIRLRSSQDDNKQLLEKQHIKFSAFKVSNDDLQKKEWKKRIMGVSDRQKALNNRLMKMMVSNGSPIKIEKLVTEAASCIHCSQKHLQNTLRRYLYERSNISMNFGEANVTEIVDELQKITEEIIGLALPVDNGSNPEDILNCVLHALKQFQSSKNTTFLKQKGQTVQIVS